MPEYVYALHDFEPENEDEVPFRAGERIEVVEKDDLYGDGWWQGRNLSGHVGLFPQSYTAPAPPPALPAADGGLGLSSADSSIPTSPDDESKPALHILAEESESESPPNTSTNIVAPIPQTPSVFMNGNDPTDADLPEQEAKHERTASGDGEVMKATMTDVQKAIEQLGKGSANGDDGSFSFASSVGDHTDPETDTDLSDADGPNNDAGESWHKDARAKLAAKAKKAVEEAEKLEAMMGGYNRRDIVPPIAAELSDESEPEDGEFTMHHSRVLGRRHSHIPEEDEGEETDQDIRNRLKQASIDSSSSGHPFMGADSTLVNAPDRDVGDVPTATKPNFFKSDSSSTFSPPAVKTPENKTPAPASPPRVREDTRSISTSTAVPPAPAPRAASPPIQQVEVKPSNVAYRESLIALPSPTGSFPGSALSNDDNVVPSPPPQHQNFNKYMSAMSNYSAVSATTDAPPIWSLPASTQNSTLVDDKDKKSYPSEWTVEEVVDWLKSKGFDQDVCNKFTEQEITGDVLLELDVNMLKTEIGILAFGKRMRIANAITDLRRPPSVVYPDTPDQLSPAHPHHQIAHTSLTPSQSVSMTHSRSVSQSYSHNSYPGTQSYTQSVRSSLGSPMYPGNGFPGPVTMQDIPSTDYVMSEAPSTERGASEYGMNVPQSISMNGKQLKLRPAQLSLSPSDGALKASAQAVSDIPEEAEDDSRGHMSDGEVPKSMRHRIFRRSVDSKTDSAVGSRHSREGLSTPDKDIKDKDRTARSRKSVDGKGNERLSIFGAPFGGTLGKGRKPAPKYSSANDETSSERSSVFGRYSNRKSSSSALPSTNSNGPVKEKEKENGRTRDSAPAAPQSHNKEHSEKDKEKETRDPSVLRKRTLSTPTSVPVAHGNQVTSPLKQGQSILEQVGESDYSGWMRKRGERYNSWKLRYFVLKGQDLYCLKSNSTSETKIKGYINIVGYKVTVDENLNPGKYGFRIEHDSDKTHYFSSDEKNTVREWMKAIMKATIGRDYSKPVISSCNIPTIPLIVAQTMNPAPRPPSPGARAATQRALRRENPNQLSSRDARVLMGLPATADANQEHQPLDTVFSQREPPKSPIPPRPSRESRRASVSRTISGSSTEDKALIEWANTHLPKNLQISDMGAPPCGGLELLRIAESIKGRPSSPPVADSQFPRGPNDDKLEGLFRLFDFLLDHDVKMGSVSINDVRQGKRDKIMQLLRALKAWEDKRRAIAQSIGMANSVLLAGSMAPIWS